MEDVAVTIFRLVIIGVILLGIVRRDKRKRMTGKDSGSDNGPERPTEIPWEPLPRPTAAPQPAPTAKSAVPAPAAEQPRRPKPLRKAAMAEYQPADAVEVDPDEAEAMVAEYYKNRQSYTPVTHTAAARTHAADTISSGEAAAHDERGEGGEKGKGGDCGENSENSGILSRFDLRDAVLYSEILKPKFDE